MAKRLFIFSLLVVFAFTLGGCATARKQKDLEIQGLRNQISVLEAQVQNRDQEINGLKEELSRVPEQKAETQGPDKGKSKLEVSAHANVKQIQAALKNAGFDPGNIDGRMGQQTRDALKAFQKANDLKVNGRANKKTWALLKKYLNEKAK